MMRHFIQLTIAFLLVLFISTFVLVVFSEYLVKRKCDFGITTSPKYLILGHSHPECAFNDSLISNLKNLSQSGESYYYTYFKIKKVIEHNPSIEVVFIEFTNNQISKYMNDWIWKDEFMKYRYPKYAPFMSITDKKILAVNNIFGYLHSNILSLKENIIRMLRQNYKYSTFVGGYLYIEREKTDSLINSMKNNQPQPRKATISEYNLRYLSKIIDFCEENNKKVIFIRTPLHNEYPGYSNESTYQQIRKNNYKSIEYLDFSRFPLKNSEFGDLEHLNHKGAKIFSIWFEQLLCNNILENTDKQTMIDEEIKKRKRETDMTNIEITNIKDSFGVNKKECVK